ncbi:hypothetical protein P0082_05385 [Candidatus Haliotispira prima]|uniref:Uncharacterized protein n=1 Tax=Candidatus Haliotispira prima TaxID=3034016 RepID=A0ABY8MKA8_9SPIO|nr:hypothetical protein P0082_05385 [Candidatus Haliotispira prima]
MVPIEAIHSYSFRHETLLLNISAGMSNFAAEDSLETPSAFAFSGQVGFKRNTLMPQGNFDALLLLRDNYMFRFQLLLNNLRNQQSNLAFGLGNENVGLLFGVSQEYTLASQSRPNKFGLGPYFKIFYNLQGIMDLQLEGVFLTNTLSNTGTNGYRSIYLYIQTLFMLRQFRIGVIGTLHYFSATVTGPGIIQAQANLVLGGSAPERLLAVDFYLSGALILNQSTTETNYSVLFIGFGTKIKFALHPRVLTKLYFEIMPLGFPVSKLDNVNRNAIGISVGLTMSFRISRKELWSPEIIPRKINTRQF